MSQKVPPHEDEQSILSPFLFAKIREGVGIYQDRVNSEFEQAPMMTVNNNDDMKQHILSEFRSFAEYIIGIMIMKQQKDTDYEDELDKMQLSYSAMRIEHSKCDARLAAVQRELNQAKETQNQLLALMSQERIKVREQFVQMSRMEGSYRLDLDDPGSRDYFGLSEDSDNSQDNKGDGSSGPSQKELNAMIEKAGKNMDMKMKAIYHQKNEVEQELAKVERERENLQTTNKKLTDDMELAKLQLDEANKLIKTLNEERERERNRLREQLTSEGKTRDNQLFILSENEKMEKELAKLKERVQSLTNEVKQHQQTEELRMIDEMEKQKESRMRAVQTDHVVFNDTDNGETAKQLTSLQTENSELRLKLSKCICQFLSPEDYQRLKDGQVDVETFLAERAPPSRNSRVGWDDVSTDEGDEMRTRGHRAGKQKQGEDGKNEKRTKLTAEELKKKREMEREERERQEHERAMSKEERERRYRERARSREDRERRRKEKEKETKNTEDGDFTPGAHLGDTKEFAFGLQVSAWKGTEGESGPNTQRDEEMLGELADREVMEREIKLREMEKTEQKTGEEGVKEMTEEERRAEEARVRREQEEERRKQELREKEEKAAEKTRRLEEERRRKEEESAKKAQEAALRRIEENAKRQHLDTDRQAQEEERRRQLEEKRKQEREKREAEQHAKRMRLESEISVLDGVGRVVNKREYERAVREERMKGGGFKETRIDLDNIERHKIESARRREWATNVYQSPFSPPSIERPWSQQAMRRVGSPADVVRRMGDEGARTQSAAGTRREGRRSLTIISNLAPHQSVDDRLNQTLDSVTSRNTPPRPTPSPHRPDLTSDELEKERVKSRLVLESDADAFEAEPFFKPIVTEREGMDGGMGGKGNSTLQSSQRTTPHNSPLNSPPTIPHLAITSQNSSTPVKKIELPLLPLPSPHHQLPQTQRSTTERHSAPSFMEITPRTDRRLPPVSKEVRRVIGGGTGRSTGQFSEQAKPGFLTERSRRSPQWSGDEKTKKVDSPKKEDEARKGEDGMKKGGEEGKVERETERRLNPLRTPRQPKQNSPVLKQEGTLRERSPERGREERRHSDTGRLQMGRLSPVRTVDIFAPEPEVSLDGLLTTARAFGGEEGEKEREKEGKEREEKNQSPERTKRTTKGDAIEDEDDEDKKQEMGQLRFGHLYGHGHAEYEEGTVPPITIRSLTPQKIAGRIDDPEVASPLEPDSTKTE
ncbi:hypothetical protein BLNAU_9279 [Blattamonas nauphoetae]|uniref:Uncharacterized protein n=1 Tax=Blattamonas nauphoetae TaxID=2049346 RepID=A0ABQ9XW80_9EUKA|nr:hypothetical protein BLNAU_9279 [Blattamonas nauphoetae]